MGFTDLLFPRNCFGCGRSGVYVCKVCIDKVTKLKQVCPICERPSIDGFTHVKCKRKLGLDGLTSIWPYQGVIRQAFIKVKYKFAREAAKELAGYAKGVLEKQKDFLPKNSALVPIPLYFLKENFRGFNQAEVLGKEIVNALEWEFLSKVLVRKRLKKPQAGLSEKQRRINIRGVFAVGPNFKLTNQPINQSYIIFDDVYTTGATLKEACKVLKRNGARSVWGLTIAR